jgi:hypothetical protein
MRFPFLLLVFFLAVYSLYSQDRNKVPVSGELSINLRALPFIRNNEYFNPVKSSDFILVSTLPRPANKSEWIEGYTLTGFFFQPEVLYYISDKIELRAGVHLLKYSGGEGFSQVKPVFSATYYFSDNTRLSLGSLSGSDKHRLHDPHFNYERKYYSYLEEGFQFITGNNYFFNDTWLNWENFIFRNDTTREIFTFGESFSYKTGNIYNLQFEFPVQMQLKHFGGQISDYPEPVITFFNMSAGVRADFYFADEKYGVPGIEYTRFISNSFPDNPFDNIAPGAASWLRFHYRFRSIKFTSSYWRSSDFYAPDGNPIYTSILFPGSGYIIPERRILTNSLGLNFNHKDILGFLLGLETYYDLCAKRMDYAVTLHFDIEKMIRILNIREPE